MFNFLKKKKEDTKAVLTAPIAGEVVSCKEIPDPTFAKEMLGKGLGIIPSEGKLYAPCDGSIDMVFDTKHAITMSGCMGADLLVHIGLDTVKLQGKPFTVHTAPGAAVKQGDLLIEFDLEAVKAAGLNPITPLVICNSDNFKVTCMTGKTVKAGDPIIELKK